MNCDVRLSNYLTVVAALLSPLIALQVQRWLDRGRDKKQRRLDIFRTLMATRATGLSVEHVKALNSIDVEFYGSGGEKEVAAAWRAYVDHLNNNSMDVSAWAVRRVDRFHEMLLKMARLLRYDFELVSIRRSAYAPVAHGTRDEQDQEIRKAAIELLKGERALRIREDVDYESSLKPSGG